MKTKINHLILFALFALLSFSACQDEAAELDNPTDQETIIANSTLTNLMSRTTANFGATDDILDGASCFSIELPVTIIVSDITIVIETIADLEQLEDLFEDLVDDEDFLNFVFPITIIFSDYSELVIENEDQLEEFINDCEVEDDVIECVDFVYPISFSVFNSEFNLIDTVSIQNDEALYVFLEELEEDDNALIVSLNYPVTLEYTTGETIEVTNNQELAEAIEAAGDDCDDEDDDCLEEQVALNLVECPWEVYLYTNDDLENLDGPYIFNFSENGVLTIAGITTEIHTTTWELSETDQGLELNIASFYYYEQEFGNWLVVECDDDELEFEHLTVDGTGLFFEQECEDDLDCSLGDISSILQECPWDFTDGTDTYSNYQMVFNENGSLQITEGNATSAIGGYWNLSLSNDGLPEIVISNLTAFSDDLEGSWIVVECDDDGELTIIRGNAILELDQDCEGDLECSADEIRANILECTWLLETNLIDSLVAIFIHFTPDGLVLNSNADNSETQIGTWEIVTIASGIFIEFTFQQGFEILNGQWQIVECEDDELYLVNGNNYITFYQDCEDYSAVFDCFDDFEIVECTQPNNVPVFNLSANTIGLINCQFPFTASFHATQLDAENNTNAIENTEAYGTLEAQVYLRIEAGNENFEIFTIYLNTEDCNLFECFESFDAVIEQCDNGTDGPYTFDLTIAFSNCTPSADVVTYHETQVDAETAVNPIVNPEAYTNVAVEQTIYVRVEINNQFQVFPIQLLIIDCNNGDCTESDVDAFLAECIWNAVIYNGSDNLLEYNFDFEPNSQIVVIYTNEITIDATWSTSQSNDGVIIEFSNVAGANIQAITGEWLVVECEENRLELHRGEDRLVLERNCD